MNEEFPTDLPQATEPPVAHPLARELARRLGTQPGAHVLVLGYGRGRNVPALRDASLTVTVIEDDAMRARDAAQRFAHDPYVRVIAAPYDSVYALHAPIAGALSTHALLHGRASEISAAIGVVREHLTPGGLLFTTLGSVRDRRFGEGKRIDAGSYAAETGAEAGVAHAFFDRAGVCELLASFEVEAMVESSAAETAGRWAHTADDAASLVHWFVRAALPVI